MRRLALPPPPPPLLLRLWGARPMPSRWGGGRGGGWRGVGCCMQPSCAGSRGGAEVTVQCCPLRQVDAQWLIIQPAMMINHGHCYCRRGYTRATGRSWMIPSRCISNAQAQRCGWGMSHCDTSKDRCMSFFRCVLAGVDARVAARVGGPPWASERASFCTQLITCSARAHATAGGRCGGGSAGAGAGGEEGRGSGAQAAAGGEGWGGVVGLGRCPWPNRNACAFQRINGFGVVPSL